MKSERDKKRAPATIRKAPLIWCLYLLLLLFLFFPSKTISKEEKNHKTSSTETNEKAEASKQSPYTGERGNFIFDHADLKNVLLFFAKIYQFNIIIDPGVSGQVTCHLIDVPWDQALDLILKQQGLTVIQEKKCKNIKPLENK